MAALMSVHPPNIAENRCSLGLLAAPMTHFSQLSVNPYISAESDCSIRGSMAWGRKAIAQSDDYQMAQTQISIVV